ncbi:uncharacterized protein B0I36DRAFT_144010 [Microdochium trichocladiopsis]|uniref:Uncharacterized protein n=1 Tax=Microdochium trichocladiopsis TaxID=1682393 RepID=A0A9P8Y2B5_9PEZI|nr:uncharacterized protein B0I36DRAFT_144010 [Microdochium trichocladiopsis]KAH7027826.1 hypothetical protein B0I36DRAFT_144010 [Microdochium trichocladiopsis]
MRFLLGILENGTFPRLRGKPVAISSTGRRHVADPCVFPRLPPHPISSDLARLHPIKLASSSYGWSQTSTREHAWPTFATFMMCWGTAGPSELLNTWYNNDVAHECEHITPTLIRVLLANLMGLVASNVFRDQDKPKTEPR